MSLTPDQLIEFFCQILRSRLSERMRGEIYKMVLREIDSSVTILNKEVQNMEDRIKESAPVVDEPVNKEQTEKLVKLVKERAKK